MSKQPIDLSVESDRSLVITALQALHRERLHAWESACRAAHSAGRQQPDQAQFELRAPADALERLGATTSFE